MVFGKKKVLVFICMIGSGMVKKLEDILIMIVNKVFDILIYILIVLFIKLVNSIKEIEKEYEIFVIVGMKDFKINVLYVLLEVLIEGEGEKLI